MNFQFVLHLGKDQLETQEQYLDNEHVPLGHAGVAELKRRMIEEKTVGTLKELEGQMVSHVMSEHASVMYT